MRARLIGGIELAPRTLFHKTPGGRWLAQTDGRLVVLDRDLHQEAQFGSADERGFHCVSPDLRFAIVAGVGAVRRVEPGGGIRWEAQHAGWGRGDSESGSAWISDDATLVWATVPGDDDEPDAWWVLDAATGRRLAHAALGCFAAGSEALRHPDGIHVGLSVGEGQDAARVSWGRYERGALVVRRQHDTTRVLCDIHPAGTAFVSTPHSDQTLCVHDFPSGAITARLHARELFAEGEGFGFQAGYLGSDRILAPPEHGDVHAVVDARTLALVERIEYPGKAVTDGIESWADGRWVTWDYAKGRFEMWTI